jgi:hypothetical protein
MVNKTEKISVLYRIQEEIAIFPKRIIQKYSIISKNMKFARRAKNEK